MKHFYLKSLFLSLFCMIGTAASAYDAYIEGIYYNLNETSKTAEVTYYKLSNNNKNAYSGSIEIPMTVIYDNMSYSVTSIGRGAFYNCTGLTSITIPNSVTSIGDPIVYNTNLERIVVASDNPVYDSRNNCNAIIITATNELIVGCKETVIPNSVNRVGDGAFADCTGLTSIIIPNSVTSIGRSAFQGCTNLISVTIGNSVTSIGDVAFIDCNSLSFMKILCSPTTIGQSVFQNCTIKEAIFDCDVVTSLFSSMSSLEKVTLMESVTSIGDGAFGGCTGLTSITIPNSVTRIDFGAFFRCTGLNSVTIPNSVTSIEMNAFSDCTGLTSVTIGNSVTSIGEGAFYGCSNFEKIAVASNNTVYDSRDNCNAIIVTATNELIVGCKETVIPNSVTTIGKSAFTGCTGLTSITIPNSVTSIIGERVFSSCPNLEKIAVASGNPVYDSRDNCNAIIVTATNELIVGCKETVIPNSVTSIGGGAFYGCIGLTDINIPNSVILVAHDAFDETPWYNNQPDGVVYAGKVAYKYKGKMPSGTSIVLNDGTLSISDLAFCRCGNLTSITIPNSVTIIGDCSFEDCTGLTSISIPNSVTSIGGDAFQGCTNLTSISIPNSVTSIGSGAFEETPWYNYQPDGLVYAGKVVYKYKGDMPSGTNIVLENGTLAISSFAFFYCSGLSSIIIPNSVTNIGKYAFSGCSNLEKIVVESGNTVYDSRDNCNAIIVTATNELIAGCKETIIPNSVTIIGDGAFQRCTDLTSVTIPNSVISIGEWAFNNCTSLTSIVCLATTPPTCGNFAFPETNKKTCMVFVPTGTKTAYQTADTWKDFLMIEEGAETMSVAEVKAEKRNTHSIYSLDGKRLNSLRKELNIIRMSDGTVKKVMVK